MARLLGFIFLFSTVLLQPALAGAAQALSTLENETAWKIANGKVEIYNSKTLPSVRPGESAIVIEYGFTQMTKAQLLGPDHKLLTIEIYEMLDSAASYGLFTYFRSPTAEPITGIGVAGAVTPSEISFHQSKYYVVLRSEEADPSLRTTMLQILRAVARSLPNDFSLPMVASKLPRENRVPNSEKFVMGAAALSKILPLNDKDPFGLSTGAEAAIAKYGNVGGENALLLLIHYPTQQLARRFLDEGYKKYSAHHPGQPTFYKRDGPMVVLVLASSSPELATTLLEQVSYVSMVSWDPKAEPPSIGLVMVRIFIFCRIMLGITFVAGLVFGAARVVIKRFFPGKVFDRPETMEVIRLRLDKKP